MKINYQKYTIINLNTWTKLEIYERGEMELPEDGTGLKGRIRRAFPGFELIHMLSHEADKGIRLPTADWSEGIIVKVAK